MPGIDDVTTRNTAAGPDGSAAPPRPDEARRLVLIGAPGSGKGTQGRILAARYGLVRLSTGELLRHEIAEGTPLGRLIGPAVERGDLVPDPVIVEVVLEHLDELVRHGPPGFLLDGFPRSVAQAVSLDEWEATRGYRLDAALRLLVPRDELRRRLLERRRTAGRADDEPTSSARRLALDDDLAPLIVAHYQARGILVDVDGEGDEQQVATRLAEAVRAITPRR